MSNKHNVVLYLDKELVEKTRELGFNLSKTFENTLKHLINTRSHVNPLNNSENSGIQGCWLVGVKVKFYPNPVHVNHMDNLTIRRAASSDVDRIVELRSLLQEHVEGSNRLIWRITEEGKKLLKQKVEDDLADSNIHVLLAEANGEIIGYVQGEVTSRSDYVPRTVGHVSLIDAS